MPQECFWLTQLTQADLHLNQDLILTILPWRLRLQILWYDIIRNRTIRLRFPAFVIVKAPETSKQVKEKEIVLLFGAKSILLRDTMFSHLHNISSQHIAFYFLIDLKHPHRPPASIWFVEVFNIQVRAFIIAVEGATPTSLNNYLVF